ncbi:VanW family protein, partial [Vibrio parahaemolyticus]|nr:VanW family protein [Vibrio parahaemolyticus]
TIIENNIPNLEDIYVPYIEIKPNVSKELYMRINGLLAHFSTSFETSENGRINNVVLSANSFKGMIVLPGEVVSYNNTTGPRSPQNGYKDAPVIINGELTPGIGGGVCQTSTTLYNALLLADLEILERHPHSIPPAYVPKGTDAAVAGTYYDLVFRNNYDFPIYIDTKIIGKTVHFYIYGDVKSRDYEIKIATEILESKPYN